MEYREELIELVKDFTEDNIDITDNWKEWEEFLTNRGFIRTYNEVYEMDLAYLQCNKDWDYYDEENDKWDVESLIANDNDIELMSNGCYFVHCQDYIDEDIIEDFYQQQQKKQEKQKKEQKIQQAYITLKNKKGIGLKRMNALLYILKNNFGEEIIHFASDIDKVKKELTKCLSELLNVRNDNFEMDYGTIKAVILNKDIKSESEDEKYVKIIRHCGYDVLKYGSDILASNVVILAEYDSIHDAYWFTYENIDDFANYIEDVLSVIKKECDNINDINFFNKINDEINDVINKYWGNTVEFDYAEFENENL